MEIKGCATYDEENNNDYVKLILHYRLAAYQPKTPKITDHSTTISKISSSSQSKTSQISSSQSHSASQVNCALGNVSLIMDRNFFRCSPQSH